MIYRFWQLQNTITLDGENNSGKILLHVAKCLQISENSRLDLQWDITSMAKESTISNDFEKQLSELESLVERMENGEISLEDSLKDFEQGIKLARSCQKSLEEAELKVKILLSEDNNEPSEFEE